MNEKRKNNNDKKVFCLGYGICGSRLDPNSAGTGIVCSRWQGKNGGSHKSACKTTDTQKRENIYLEIKGNRNRKSFKEGYL